MKINIKGIEIDFNPLTYNSEAPILQPLLRDTSPNALRKEKLEKDFGPIKIGIDNE